MSSRLQLPASAEYAGEADDPRDAEIRRLKAQLTRLVDENSRLREELAGSTATLHREQAPLRQVKKILDPLHRALQALYGEIEAAGIEDSSAPAAAAAPGQPIPETKYAAWKQRLSPACGKIIDALLVQPLTHSQMVVYCKMHFDTIGKALKIMKANALLEQDGKVYRLKP
jgi:hypothetical protein